jgi:flagellar protein FliS
MSFQRAAQAYSQIGVETGVGSASPHQLIVMLYDGALDAIAQARGHLAAGRREEKGRALSRAIAIVDEGLRGCLDPAGGDIAVHLGELYAYMCRRLLVAGAHHDDGALAEVAGLLAELRGAWLAIGSAPAASVPSTLHLATA